MLHHPQKYPSSESFLEDAKSIKLQFRYANRDDKDKCSLPFVTIAARSVGLKLFLASFRCSPRVQFQCVLGAINSKEKL